jgi:hypothetical protein
MILTHAASILARAEICAFGAERFSTNPSVIRFTDGRLCAVKGVNFDLESIRLSGDWQALDPREPINCRYKIVHLDDHFRLNACFDLDTTEVSYAYGKAVHVEDLRLFWRGDAVWACGGAVDRDNVFTGARWIIAAPRTRMFIGELILNRLENVQILASPIGAREEKNWMPVVRGERLDFVVDINRSYKISLSEAPRAASMPPLINSRWRGWSGSSALVRDEHGFLAVIHRKTPPAPYLYEHMFVFFDADLNLRRRSAPFRFEGAPVEFCCGLTIEDGVIELSYGVMDKRAVVTAFSRRDLLAMLQYDVKGGDLPGARPVFSGFGVRVFPVCRDYRDRKG